MRSNIFNDDFRDLIKLLNDIEVEYILVGGYAVILNGYRRTTGDIDIWVNTNIKNYKKLFQVFIEFGLPTTDFTEYAFLENDGIDVFTFGIPPVSIDLMKFVKGLSFKEAFETSKIYHEDGLDIRFLQLSSLIEAKKASGRYKDLDDIEKLEKKNK